MSAIAAPLGAPAAAPGASARRTESGPSTGLELALFVALASFAAVHWALFVTDPPYGRVALVVAVATTGGGALALLGRARIRGALLHVYATAVALATAGLCFVMMGLPARLLIPAGWNELSESLDRGLGGINTVTWPYGGEDDWVRLAILLGAPLVLSGAAALAFWPAGRAHGPLRVEALVLLVVLYAIPVTERSLGGSLARGLVLLLLLAAWLWLPRIGLRRALPAAAVVLAVGVCSLPVAAKLDADQAWWDYSDWQWFGVRSGISFDWNHSYGPLDWSRDGTTLLNVRSRKARYWKVETLDRFDGLRWLHSRSNESGHPSADLPARPDRRWVTQTRFTVRSLKTDFVVGPGTIFSVQGAGAVSGSSDGTTTTLDAPLERGDSYTVLSYAPDPSARRMRAVTGRYRSDLLQYTGIFLPRPGETALAGGGLKARPADRGPGAEGERVEVPLKGLEGAGEAAAERRLLASPYADVYRLARRLTDGRPTTFDAVKAVEDHLQRNYDYSERVPTRAYPLAGFLFKDRRGYCQQFAGAMALMLRMSGIPARAASGFSPGSYNRDTREYRVRDLDAHSWVEVFFPSIGWVPFDPTPTASPAESQSAGSGATSAARGDAGDVSIRDNGGSAASERAGESAAAPARPKRDGGSTPLALMAAVTAALLAVGGSVVWALGRRRRRLGADPVEADLQELREALVRLGWKLPAGTTLLALEHRLGRAGGPVAAGYAGKLRALRFSAAGGRRPSSPERRALRRELTRGAGTVARLRGFLAFPPRRKS